MPEEKPRSTVSDLPQDTLIKSGEYLLNKDLASFAAVSTGYHGIFQPMLEINKLLLHVACGEQDQAEAMLRKNPALALKSGSVTDLSGRTFTNITAFQYAVWAMDWHMWTMLLTHMPRDGDEAAKQLQNWDNRTDAQRNGHGQYFSLEPLIQAYNSYINNYDDLSVDDRKNYWCQIVGGAQRLLPACVVNQFCRQDQMLNFTPTFTETSLLRTRRVYVNTPEDEWFSVVHWERGDKIGKSFAIERRAGMVRFGTALASDHPIMNDGCINHDRSTIQSLSTTRTEQWASLRSDLSRSLVATPADAKEDGPQPSYAVR